jgi:poly(3-hydroxybutyrate) depolymerase
MLMFDCDGLEFCNNEASFGFDCYVNNEFCEDFNGDGITDSWVGDGWCDDGEWGYDFQCEEYSFDCGDCGDEFSNTYGYCDGIPESYSFNHGGLVRQYYLYVPDFLEENAPLVFVMHGYGGSANGIISYSGMSTIADQYGFAVCYPNGTIDQSGNRFWNVGYNMHQNETVDDVDFLSSLAQYLQEEYNLSNQNTFSTGMSNGGDISYLLACQAPNIFSAIAPVAGCMMTWIFESCDPSHPVPVLEIHGTNDNVTWWEGSHDSKIQVIIQPATGAIALKILGA